jgi:3-deoxy-D-manno-octulosonic acid (KDO) 8-phosphate synthase
MEAGMKLNYKRLCIEMKRMYNMKCMIIPVIIGATGSVTKGLNKRFEAIPGKRSIDLLQKNITHNRESLKLEG